MNFETSTINISRLDWDLRRRLQCPVEGQFENYWEKRKVEVIPAKHFERPGEIWLEIGAGSGTFFVEMARRYPETFLIAIERAKDRATRLVRKAAKSRLPNLAGVRGNAIPALMTGVPSDRLSRIYIMYPCPWPKTAHRKNRWYLHPVMPHLIRILRPGGRIIWTSDQKFYIDEARFVCESRYGLKILTHAEITPNAYNDLGNFPGGRTKFERTFLAAGNQCYEVVVEKPETPSVSLG